MNMEEVQYKVGKLGLDYYEPGEVISVWLVARSGNTGIVLHKPDKKYSNGGASLELARWTGKFWTALEKEDIQAGWANIETKALYDAMLKGISIAPNLIFS